MLKPSVGRRQVIDDTDLPQHRGFSYVQTQLHDNKSNCSLSSAQPGQLYILLQKEVASCDLLLPGGEAFLS